MDADKILESLSGFKFSEASPSLLERFMPKTEAVLVAKAKDFSADDQKRLVERKLKTVDSAIYVAADLVGSSGIFEMINGQDQAVGICSLDKGKIPVGENYSIDRVFAQICFSSDSNIKRAYFSYLESVSAFAPLRNADLSIWADTRQIASIPFSAFIHHDQNSFNTFKFDKPIFLKAEDQLELKIEYPRGVTLPTSNHYYLKILLRGVKTIKR